MQGEIPILISFLSLCVAVWVSVVSKETRQPMTRRKRLK
jgi:hypothetical protein